MNEPGKGTRIVFKLVIVVAVFFIGFSVGRYETVAPTLSDQNLRAKAGIPASLALSIDFGNGEIREFADISYRERGTVFDILKEVTEKNEIGLEYKDYGSGLGMFVESIGGVKGSGANSAWWQFWVNDEYSEKGASSVAAAPGDAIKWKFTSNRESE